MGKPLLISLVLLICSSAGYAQEQRFGMKTGVVFSSLAPVEARLGAEDVNWKSNISYSSGIFYNTRLRDLISFQIELDYKRTGAHISGPNTLGGSKVNYEFEYIGLSLLPRLDLFPDSGINPNFMIGPYADFRLESGIGVSFASDTVTTLLDSGSLDLDTKNYTRKVNLGLALAGGIEIKTDPVIITLEARYSSSFDNAFKESVEDLQLNADNLLLKLAENAKHEYFSILVGFNFYF